MKWIIAFLITAGFAVLPAMSEDKPGDYELSGPYSYRNLTLYLIHGENRKMNAKIITLQEALAAKIVVVFETENVNRLEISNLSGEYEIFIMAGDIVKGGKQDRTIQYNYIIPKKAKHIGIDSFCVEQGRWDRRGNEDASGFNSSDKMIASKDLKLSVKKSKSQGEVWSNVARMQDKLEEKLGGPVKGSQSESSLQLTLENKNLKKNEDEYYKRLGSSASGKGDVIGYAFVINGKINSAEVFATNDLFKKLWQKLVRASIQEAVSDYSESTKFSVPSSADIRKFMAESERGRKASSKQISSTVKQVERESDENLYFETRSGGDDQWVNKSFMKK